MIYLAVGQLLVMTMLIGLLLYVARSGQEEREALEDRLMAICHPIALTHVDAVKNSEMAHVRYVGEEAQSARNGATDASATT